MREIIIKGKIYCEYDNNNMADDYLLSMCKRKSDVDWYRDGRGDIRDRKTKELICKADQVIIPAKNDNSFSFSPPEPLSTGVETTENENRVVND